MDYKNTTNIGIYLKIPGGHIYCPPGEIIKSDTFLKETGLICLSPQKKELKVNKKKPAPKIEKPALKIEKPVIENDIHTKD